MKESSKKSLDKNNSNKKSNDSEDKKDSQTELETTKKELEAMHSRFNSLFEKTNDAIILIDLETQKYRLANQKAAELFGFKLEDIDKFSASSFVFEDESTDSLEKLEELKKGKILPIYIRKFRKNSGEIFFGEVNLSLVEDPISKRTLIQSIVRDITNRKHAEQNLERDRLIFQKVANAAIQTTDVPEFCNRVLSDLLDHLDFDIGTLRIYDQEKELLTPLAVLGLTQDKINELRPMKLTDEQYIISQALITGKPLFAPDVSKTPELKKYKSRLELFEIKALISWPILDKNRNILGALQLSARKPKIIPDEDKALFESIAIMLANALERFNAEKALEKAFHEREEIDQIIEMSPAIIFLWRNEKGWPVDFVTNNVHILGFTPEDFYSGKISYRDLILEEDARIENIEVDLYSQKEYPYEFPIDYRIKTKSGEIKWVMEYSTPRRDINGNITHYHGLILDITDRKKQEESLIKAYNDREELDRTINLSPAVVFLWKNKEGWPVEFVSDNIVLYGYKPEDFYSEKLLFAEIIHKDDLQKVIAEEKEFLKDKNCNEYVMEYRILTKSGDIRWIYNYNAIRRNHEGIVTHFQGIVLDTTESKIAEESLRNERRAFQIIADAAATATTVPELCQRILNGLIDALDFDIGSVRLYNEEDRLLEPIANVHVENATGREVQSIPIDSPDFINALVARTKSAIFAPDIKKHEIAQAYIERLKKINVGAVITWPLLDIKGDLIGILQLAAFEPKEIPEEDRIVFETISGTLTNAIERLIADEARRESEEKFRAFAEQSLTGVILFTKQGEILFANKEMENISEYPMESMLRTNAYEFLIDYTHDKTADLIEMFQSKLIEDAEKPTKREFRLKTRSGKIKWLSINITPINVKDEIVFASMIVEITEQKQAQLALIRERLVFKLVAEIALFSRDLTELNEKMTRSLMDLYEFDVGSIRLFDEASNKLILSSDFGLSNLLGDNPQPIDINETGFLVAKVALDKKPFFIPDTENSNLEEKLLERTRKLKIKGLVAFPIVSDSDELIGTLSLASFKTLEIPQDDFIFFESVIRLLATAIKRKQAEDELRELNEELELRVQQRTAQLVSLNKELEAFSYSVSHDLRTPLRSIDGFSQALLEDYTDQLDETGQDYLTRVRSACKRMSNLIDDILSLSRLTRKNMDLRVIDLSKIANEIISELQEIEPDRKVNVKIEKNLEAVGDPVLIRTIFENLFGNAWKFTSKKSKARIVFGKKIINNEEVYFIQDDGVGFNQAYKDKLFAVFQRLHTYDEFKGTGIGLAIVQRIINRHGGRVWAESEMSKGATFYFTIPTVHSFEEIKK